MIDHLYIKRLAAGAGFDLCGIAPCRHLAENEALFRAWLARGRQSSLGYLERNVDKRFDARRLVEGARTAVVCAVSYKNRVGEGYPPGHRTKVASYACAADYHATLRTMLGGMLDALRAAHPGLGRPRLRRHRAAGRKAAGRRGRAGVDRPAVAARHAAIRELRRAGRADSHRRDRPLRRAVRRVALRNLPQLHRQLPHGSRRPGQDHRHGPLHLVPHHRAGTARSERTFTAGSSAATRARASAPGTAAPRSTATRRSMPCSTRWRWTPRRGSAWMKRRSKPSAAARR